MPLRFSAILECTSDIAARGRACRESAHAAAHKLGMSLTIRIAERDRQSPCHIEVVDAGPAGGFLDGLRRYEARVVSSGTGERHGSSTVHHDIDDGPWLLAQRALLAVAADRALPA